MSETNSKEIIESLKKGLVLILKKTWEFYLKRGWRFKIFIPLMIALFIFTLLPEGMSKEKEDKADTMTILYGISIERARDLVDELGMDAFDKINVLVEKYPLDSKDVDILLGSENTKFDKLSEAFSKQFDIRKSELAKKASVDSGRSITENDMDDFKDAYLSYGFSASYDWNASYFGGDLKWSGFTVDEYIDLMKLASAHDFGSQFFRWNVSADWVKQGIANEGSYENFISSIKKVKEGFPKDWKHEDINLPEWYESLTLCQTDFRKCKTARSMFFNWEGTDDLRRACRDYVENQLKWGVTWAWGLPFNGFTTTDSYVTDGTFIFYDDNAKLKNGFGAERSADIRCNVDLDNKKVLGISEV